MSARKVCRAYKADGHKGTHRRDFYELRYGKGIGVTELPIPRGDGRVRRYGA